MMRDDQKKKKKSGRKNPEKEGGTVFFLWSPSALGGKSYIRTLDTMIFSFQPLAGQSPRVEKFSSRENNGVRGTKLLQYLTTYTTVSIK